MTRFKLFHRITLEHALYFVAFFLGTFLRFYHLGSIPLSDFEAGHALRALSNPLAIGASSSVSPAYIILTGITFDLFGSSDFSARFWPAAAGSMLVLTPLLFRRELGRKAGLILAFGLALDPGLVALSRLAGDAMLAITFTILFFGCLWAGYPILAGIFLATSLLSGSTSIVGFSIFLITWLVARGMRLIRPSPLTSENIRTFLRPAFTAAAFTFLVAVVLLLNHPADLAGIATGIADYFNRWASISDYSTPQFLVMLVIYQALPLLFIVAHLLYWLVRQSLSDEPLKPPPVIPLLWLVISILIVFINPGKQAWDLAWTIIPMWVLTAQILVQLLPGRKPHVISLTLAGTIFILLALFWNTIVSSRQIISIPALNLPETTSRLLVQIVLFIGVIGLGGLSTLLVSLGWSTRVGRDGLVLGLLGGFVFYTISATWGVSQLRQNRPEELWFPAPAPGQVDLFMSTVSQISEQNTGFSQMIDIISVVDSSSMRWNLRDFSKAGFTNGIPTGEMPSVVITPLEEENPSLESTYRGQDFSWEVWRGWSGALPEDFINWFVTRQAPIIEKQVILWIRSDLFPGGQIEPTTESQ